MGEIRLSARAENDLRNIWKQIAEHNPRAADRLFMRIMDKLETASEHHLIGASRPSLSPTARILVVGNYISIYEPSPEGIFVIAIVHGARDPDNWI